MVAESTEVARKVAAKSKWQARADSLSGLRRNAYLVAWGGNEKGVCRIFCGAAYS